MPATPSPITGPLGPVWTPILQAAQAQKQKTANLATANQQGGIYDAYYNCVELSGSSLNQVVTIGAHFQHGGVEVGTDQVSGAAGTIKQTNLAVGTITLTQGSTGATLVSTDSGSFTSGQVIGAVTASDVNAITPGTTFTISGSSIILSQAALTSGAGLYAAACNWVAV